MATGKYCTSFNSIKVWILTCELSGFGGQSTCE